MRIDDDKKTERVQGIETIEDAARRAERLGYYAGDEEAESFSLGTAANGEAVRLLDEEMAKVAANILDRETKATTPRVITLKVTIVPEENRTSARLLFESTSKLAGKAPAVSSIGLGEAVNGDILIAPHDVRQGVLKIR